MMDVDIGESFGRSIDGVLRVNRSTDGRQALWFHPDWRFRQAQIYHNLTNEAPEGEEFYLPEWEDDNLVVNYYVFKRTGRCTSPRWTELISMAVQCQEWNDQHGLASRIKAYAVAHKSDQEIADSLGLDEEIVGTYLDLFYDIRSILMKRERMASVIFPFSPEAARKYSPSEQREFLWIAAAFAGDEDLLEFFTTNKFEMDAAGMERCMERIISMMSAQSMEYGVYLRTEGLPRATHFDKWVAIQDVYVRHAGVKAQTEQMQQESKLGERLDRWDNLLDAVGIRRASGRVIDSSDSMVTNLSISELRSGQETTKEREEDVRKRVTDPESGVGVESFD